jgi:hypothetical protein
MNKNYTPYKHYLLSRIAMVRVPKAGCTTLTRWIRDVEKELMKKNGMVNDTSSPIGVQLKSIHEAPPGVLRIATLRNPVDRMVSVFFNKLVKAPDGHWVFSYFSTPWFPRLSSLEELKKSFRGFIQELHANEVFRRKGNFHWQSQSEYVPDISAFDLVIPIERLSDIPSLVASKREDLSWVIDMPVIKLNQTDSWLADYVLEEDLVHLIEETYADDLSLLDQFGISRDFKRKVGLIPDPGHDTEAEIRMLREQRRIAYHGIIDRYHGSSNA